jgi:two-component system OmpR family sensor kinase
VIGRLSLRTRLVALSAALLAVGLLVAAGAAQALLSGHLIAQLDGLLRPAASALARTPVAQAQDSGQRLQREKSIGLFGSPVDVYYLDRSGRVVTELSIFQNPGQPAPQLPPLDSAAAARRVSPFTVPSQSGDGQWRVVARRYSGATPASGSPATVVIATSMNQVDATISTLRSIFLAVDAGLLAVLAVAGWFAIRSGLRPLTRIEETAAAIADGDLSRRIPDLAAPTTEVGRLAAALNGMLLQIETAFRARADSETRMRRFVADASHELRTPLVGIKGSTDLYRMGSREDVDAMIARIAGESERLTRLVEDLLLLARLDEGPAAFPLHLAPADLRTLAADAFHDVRGLDPSRPVTLTGPDGGEQSPALALADEERLRQVVTNLVGNAVAHTPAGTPLRIGAGRRDGFAILEVADSGDGLAPEEAARVFERFYRADASRARSGPSRQGAGLGLAIAQSIVTAHGGRIELITAPGQGATFRILLPGLTDGDTTPDDYV